MGNSQELEIKAFKKQDGLSIEVNNYQYELLSNHLNCFLGLEFYANDEMIPFDLLKYTVIQPV